MDAHRKLWNKNQKELREKLPKALDFINMQALLLRHHSSLHTANLGQENVWSFEDEIWQGLDEAGARCIPSGHEHSIAWLIWHMARIEDLTMNILVAAQAQILHKDNWLEQINLPFEHTGNEISTSDMAILNTQVDIAALKAYRKAVGAETQQIIRELHAEDLPKKVAASHIRQVRESGSVLPTAHAVVEYWSKRSIAGLLLMPATRHNFIHLNEALRVKAALMPSVKVQR